MAAETETAAASAVDHADVPGVSEGVSDSYATKALYALTPWFYPVYSRTLGAREQFVARMKRRLAAAHITLPVEIYLAGALGMGILTGLAIGFTLSVLFVLAPVPGLPSTYVPTAFEYVQPLWALLEVPVVVSGLLALGVLIGVTSALASATVVPKLRIYQRRREINLLLPDTVAFMYALSVGGMDQMQIIGEVAESEDTYGEVAVEFRRIHNEMTYFNRDYRTAVERVAEATPSDPFSQFLTDLLSIINSGGDMTQFLEAEKDHQLQAVRQSQEARLDILELFGQAYLSLSTVPMFALIVFVLMSMLGTPQPVMLYSVVYGLIPGLNVLFIVLLSTAKKDEPGTGTLDPEDEDAVTGVTETSLVDLDVIDKYLEKYGSDDPTFAQIRRQEIRYRLSRMFTLRVFKRRPAFTLVLTVPLALTTLLVTYALGLTGPPPDALLSDPIGSLSAAFEAAPVRQTLGWVLVPSLLVLVPLSVAYETKQRSRATITNTLTSDIRKMANANEAGNSVLESIRIAAEDNPSRLADELRQAYEKVNYGHSLSDGLVELNNRYRQPRLARSIKLIERAQRASDKITGVLRTAAKLSETHDELDTEYEGRMQQQVAILTVTFLVLLGVLVFLRVFFIPTIGDLVADNQATQSLTGASMDRETINLLYFHAALLQATMTGLITGYIRKTSVWAGLKYVVVYTVLTAGIWMVMP